MHTPKRIKYIAWAVFGLLVCTMLTSQMWGIVVLLKKEIPYQLFAISDWLINYQGGFVRRGIIGECLYQLYQIQPYTLPHAITLLYYASFAIFVYVFGRLLIRNGLSVFLLPSTLFLFYALGGSFIACRRDYIALLLTWYIFYAYFQYIEAQRSKHLLCFALLSVFTLLMHEASFFFTFPILFLYHLTTSKDSFLRKCLLFAPAGLAMLIVSVYKGGGDVATQIWHSWLPTLYAYPLDGNVAIGWGVEFLKNNLVDTLLFHINITWVNCFGHPFLSVVGNLYIFAVAYFLVTRLNTIHLGCYQLKQIDTTILSTILLIQALCVSPLFGFLSCDLGRTIPYWVISSLMFYVLHQHHTSKVQSTLWLSVDRFSARVQQWIDSKKLLANPYFYMFCVLTLPLKFEGNARWGDSIPLLVIVREARRIIVYLLSVL